MALTDQQIEQLRKIEIPWGEIGYITYKRTYARRIKEDKVDSPTEEYIDTVLRVVKACQKQLKVNFTNEEEYKLAEILLKLKGSVAGRFLWQLGTKTVDNLGLPSLQNCAVCVVNEPIRPFTWAMEMLMLGCGVGYNIQKEYVYQIPSLRKEKLTINRVDDKNVDFIVPDTREGWVKLLGKVLKAHFYTGKGFTYSCQMVRSEGELIKSFGGTASGPSILEKGIDQINNLLNDRAGKKLRPIDCLDIMNIIASIIVAGNVRRSAQLAIGDWDDLEFLKAKRWDLGSVPNWRSNSNNSIVPPINLKDLPTEFWQTYEQGEPYGLINLELSRNCGRLGETQYKDSNIVGYNPCFVGSTDILTPDGYVKIGENVGKLKLVNYEGVTVDGKIWSNGNKQTVKVSFTNGQPIFCTPDHRFMLTDGSEETAANLKGKRIMPFMVFNNETNEYVKYGFLQGDGGLGRLSSPDHKGLEINIGKNDNDVAELFGISIESNKRTYYINGFNEILSELKFDPRTLIDRAFPATFDSWSDNQKLSFLRGMFSANGSVVTNHRVSYKAVSLELITKLSEILQFYGIDNYITTNKAKANKFSNGTYMCRQSYDLNICKFESIKQFAQLISFVHDYKKEALADLMLKKSPMVVSVKSDEMVEVFDFSLNDDTHWGVVGDGFIAHNCAEQSLENFETCCLAEIFLPNIENESELFEVSEFLYRINKHSLSLPCSISETEDIVHKNMRMGIGVTGLLQSTEEQKSWLANCYDFLRKYDVEYSAQHNWPVSIKLTTTKPSGTLSLLPGVTPGIHPSPAGPYYIRRIRMAANSNLVQVCKDNGYFVEFVRGFDGKPDFTTVVVEFPCKVPEGTPVGDSLGAIEHLNLIKWMQSNWSDNSVSCTVYYSKEELPAIQEWLIENFNNSLKTVSFLLYYGHGFEQAPYETISKERYDELIKNVKPIHKITVQEDDFDVQDCDNGSCPIK